MNTATAKEATVETTTEVYGAAVGGPRWPTEREGA
jgi:hypothetical protein